MRIPLIDPNFYTKMEAMAEAERNASGPPESLSRLLFERMKAWSLDGRNLYPIHLPQLARELAKAAESHKNNPRPPPALES